MIIRSWEEFLANPANSPCAVTCGVFDGVHRGHRALIERVVAADGLPGVVVTFSDPPRRVINSDNDIITITSREEKIAIIEEFGVSLIVMIDFTSEFRATSGEDFFSALHGAAKMKHCVLGHDFKCGRNGEMKLPEIKQFCDSRGITLEVVRPVIDSGAPISSSRIRAALLRGDKDEAERLLGRKV